MTPKQPEVENESPARKDLPEITMQPLSKHSGPSTLSDSVHHHRNKCYVDG